MNPILQNMVDSLKNYSQSLSKKSILVNKPWALIDSDLEIQKLIFKKNNELIMSKDGQASIGRWEYLPEARSLLIDRGIDTILCNEAFIDIGILILKLDGTKGEFFVLANENIIPDLDAYSYLKKLTYEKLNIVTRKLENGKRLEITRRSDMETIKIGNKVSIDLNAVENGVYKEDEKDLKYIIKDSALAAIIYEKRYKTKNGLELLVQQHRDLSYKVGERVCLNDQPAPDGLYKMIGARNIIVKDGKISKVKIF